MVIFFMARNTEQLPRFLGPLAMSLLGSHRFFAASEGTSARLGARVQ